MLIINKKIICTLALSSILSLRICASEVLTLEQKNEGLRSCMLNFTKSPSRYKKKIMNLIVAGADVNTIANETSPLYYMVKTGDATLTAELLTRGAKVDTCVPYGSNILEDCPNIEIMRLLLQHGAKARTCLNTRLKCNFACNYTPKMLQLAIQNGADVNMLARSSRGEKTPLLTLVWSDQSQAHILQMLALFLRAGARDCYYYEGVTLQSICLYRADLYKEENKKQQQEYNKKMANFIGLYSPEAKLSEIILRTIIARAYSIDAQERADAVAMINVIKTNSSLIESRAPIALVYDPIAITSANQAQASRCSSCAKYRR